MKTELQKVSEETIRFMRGQYALDEVPHGENCLKFCHGDRTILSIKIHKDRCDFQIDNSTMFSVADLKTLEVVKQLIKKKMKPNRKPFPKEQAVFSDCGHRCDLCVHYVAVKEELRKKMHGHICNVYGWTPTDEIPLCNGCSNGGLDGDFDCDQIKCAKDKGVPRCIDCNEYACDKATVGWKPAIEIRSISADDVTWAILPFVEGQYGN